MEPRPQRPRSTPGQGQHPAPPQTGRPLNPPPGYPGGATEGYVDEYDEQTYIAPPRTEYDYSPLDLAPPGQRRRRQFVAAAIGALAILMVVAIGVLGYLLFKDEDNDPDLDVIALQTQNAESTSTVQAQGTLIADAGAAQTATAGGEAVATTEPSEEADSTSDAESTEPADSDETPEATSAESTETSAETTSETPSTDSGEAGPNVTALNALLPPADVIPATLDTDEDSSLDQASVVVALGSSRTAEQNLERWGWSGNSGRVWTASDPETVEAGTTTSLSVSVHGFKDATSAAEALPFFSDILLSSEDPVYEEGTDPGLGDLSRVLTATDANGGIVVALYVQKDNIMYRFGGYAPAGGDPTADVLALADATLPAGE